MKIRPKICSECGAIKLQNEFEKFKQRRTGRSYFHRYCKQCQKIKHLRRLQQHGCQRNYREREYLLKATRPRPTYCEACGGVPTGKALVLSYDHDHRTGKFRGWICNNCNTILGFCRDDSVRLQKLINYLNEFLIK